MNAGEGCPVAVRSVGMIYWEEQYKETASANFSDITSGLGQNRTTSKDMKLTSLVPLAFVAFCVTTGAGAQSSQSVLSDLKDISNGAANLKAMISGLSKANVGTDAHDIAAGLQNIVGRTSSAIGVVEVVNPKPFSDKAASEVVDALALLTSNQKGLISELADKKEVFEGAKFTGPISDSLLGLQGVDDTYLTNIIKLIPSQKSAATKLKSSLDVLVESAIMSYS
ncbi:hypothetical protein OE88DRAFT_1662848 [Heliocybe sulcata]|uniref:Hydrophobic surface binding protein n=1 Tax=Heliocybe sulcata TaxID=5364 RepID=A0A5C3MWU7_9AGAM|nr:hypothetical protein OE88DRAFT_1662848 [Heliocybe sulcata]